MNSITEKQLEDFICKHPEYSLWRDVKIIGRQVSLEHGRLDILAWDGRVQVIELKARPLKEKDIGQVLRYKRDIEAELNRFGAHEYPRLDGLPNSLRLTTYRELWSEYFGLSVTESPAVTPVLIGTDIDSYTHAAADGGGIHVILWRYDKKENAITFSSPRFLLWNDGPYPEWCQALCKLITQSCARYTNALFDRFVSILFNISTEDYNGQLSR